MWWRNGKVEEWLKGSWKGWATPDNEAVTIGEVPKKKPKRQVSHEEALRVLEILNRPRKF